MKKLVCLFIALLPLYGAAQSTTVSGTAVDSTAVVWSNASIQITLQGPNPPYQQGGVNAPTTYSATTNGSGVFSISLPSNSSLAPGDSTYAFSICGNTSIPCANPFSVFVTGTTLNISSNITAALGPQTISASPIVRAYNNNELVTPQNPGSLFFDTTLLSFKFWSGTAWTAIGGSGGAVASVFGRTGAVVAAANDYNFTQIAGSATIAQLPGTVVQSVGTTSANTMLKWVTSNTATNGSLVDNGTTVTTTEAVGAANFIGPATGLTGLPVSQLASSSQVSPIATGLIGEYHINEAPGATTGIDYSGNGNNGIYVGTPGLSGTLAGGMTTAGAGYLSYPASFNTALTFSTYTCTTAQQTLTNTYNLLIGGLMTATAPTSGNTQAFGMMMQNSQTNLAGSLFGKYDIAPSTFNTTTFPTMSQQTMDGCHLITWVRGTTKDQFYIDGAEVSFYQYQPAGSSAIVPASGSFALGMPPYATLPTAAFGYPYPIYFNFVFSNALTAAQVKSLAGSSATYAQLRGITKTTPIFSDPGNQILTVGDSITFGVNGTPWPQTVAPTVNPYISISTNRGNNIGTPSWQTQNMLQECQSRGYGSFNPNSNTTVIIWTGTNDIAETPVVIPLVTPAVAYGRLRRLVQCYKGATPNAPRVFIITMISRGVAGGVSTANDALKNTYNDMLRRDFAGADGLIDIASFAGFGADGASANAALLCGGATCFGADHVHPSATGETVIASYVSNYIDWADSKTQWTNPTLQTGATYQELVSDYAVTANPTTASQTITLPSAVGLVGTDRIINNAQASGANTLTIAPVTGESIGPNAVSAGVLCANATTCKFRSVLGATQGLATGQADIASGAHWEQF